jgi:hypothetical protein
MNARLLPTQGLSHTRVLRDAAVAQATLAHLAGGAWETEPAIHQH